MKIFYDWYIAKKKIHRKILSKNVFFYERDIWWIHMGQNIGSEQNGKGEKFLRPVLILKKHNSNCFLGLALTKTNKDHRYFYTFFCNDDLVSGILSQIRLYDSRRIYVKLGSMKKSDFDEIKNAVTIINFGKPRF